MDLNQKLFNIPKKFKVHPSGVICQNSALKFTQVHDQVVQMKTRGGPCLPPLLPTPCLSFFQIRCKNNVFDIRQYKKTSKSINTKEKMVLDSKVSFCMGWGGVLSSSVE